MTETFTYFLNAALSIIKFKMKLEKIEKNFKLKSFPIKKNLKKSGPELNTRKLHSHYDSKL